MAPSVPRRPFADQCGDNLDVAFRWQGRIPDAAWWHLVCGLIELFNKYHGQ